MASIRDVDVGSGGMGADTLGGAVSIAYPSLGFHTDSRCRLHSRLTPQEDRLGTIDLHFGRAIVPNGSSLFRNGLLLKSPRFEIRCILLSDLAQEGG
jgi:hypothetical protein